MKLRINEAIAEAKQRGIKVRKADIAAAIWPDSNVGTRQVNFTRLCNGTAKSVTPETIVIICRMCGCSADFLFGTNH